MKLFEFVKNATIKDMTKNIGKKLASIRPEIMLVTGGLSVLGGTIYACTKTEKCKKVVEEHKTRMEEIKSTEFTGDEKEQKIQKGKAYTRSYIHTAYELTKVYGVPILLWFGGMGMIFESHGELRKINKHLVTDSIAAKKLFDEYRDRVANAVGKETEQKIFMGAQEGTVHVLEKDEVTGEEKIVEKKADIFYAQPGSIFARNFTEETSDAFDIRSFSDYYLENRIELLNKRLELGVIRAATGLDILRALGFNESALGEGESVDALVRNGISGNARLVPDPEMRKLKVTRLRGYQKKWDVEKNLEVYVPCLRLDFNFYPLEGKI